MVEAQARLASAELSERMHRLGFRGADAADALDAARRVLAEDRVGPGSAVVARLADLVVARIGSFLELGEPSPDPWSDPAAADSAYGQGVLPMLALLVSADEVVAFHRSRGLDEQTAWNSLADLGQQVWVHRQTFGEFGLHTHGWLLTAWSGALLWLGRLQFELQRADSGPYAGRWQLSTHIPQTGPLTPEAVDEAFERAPAVFAPAFPDQPVAGFHCRSWLLDPQLAQVLAPSSNLVRFQQRWSRYGEALPGDEDVTFFVFRQRGAVELDELPQSTTLERAVVSHWREGGHWHLWDGTLGKGER